MRKRGYTDTNSYEKEDGKEPGASMCPMSIHNSDI